MKLKIIVLFIAYITICCKNSNKIERENEPTIYNVERSDREMNEAITKANQTLSDFNLILLNPKIEVKALKVKFETPKGNEHIWLSNIQYENGKYSGVLDNLPEYITEYKIGDKIEIENSKISDWMYVENGKLFGGYTIKLLRSRMTESEKKEFDAENGLKIE